VNWRRRTFPEILENLLTTATGGVASESYPMPPNGAVPPFRHDLEQPPVAAIVSVYGTRDGQPHRFQEGADFRLLADRRTVEWQAGAALPDFGSLVQISYRPQSAASVLSDVQTGSVLRTLSEAVALEIARLYAQLEIVYQSGFVDTASGKALDNVVALLGISRVESGRAAGEVEFIRAASSAGSITIPAGTRIITAEGNVEYETVQEVTLNQGQDVIRAVARDLEPNDPLPAGALTVLPVPIAGIVGVTNPKPTAAATQAESDDELRTRAKSFLHGSERATLGAIRQAIAVQGIAADVTELTDTPGRIEITPHADTLSPEQQQRLLAAIEASRPAGVLVTLKGVQPPKRVNLALHLTTAANLPETELRAAHHAVRDTVTDFFARLPAKEPASVNRLVGLILAVPGVEDVAFVSASVDGAALDPASGQLDLGGFPTTLGELQIADPNLPTLLNVTVTYPETQAGPDSEAITSAISATLSYLNDMNANGVADDAKRALSFGKLLLVVPLPGKSAGSLQAFDAAPDVAALPDETAVSPYQVRFVFTAASGLSRIVAKTADAAYNLAPHERLSLSAVSTQAEE
jgi:hypothetical protein